MVMRNGNDGTDARRWWDDVPPRVRARISGRPTFPEVAETESDTLEPRPLFSLGELFYDLSRLALLFFAIAVANMVFLIVALSFLRGG
ncbi:hypothetical protein J8F10_21235 [Gemmata sp. G18]|uniref:Uncharacterized protein n=1 Tax=Gemmata palustris TaxID=2822762 RepID=A0ABS5BVQ9_9BACT|nr:hypothetical protein [Gemmata palustris]MBP3957784.1 hypothetical protein [Gemmata palustris]